MDSHVLAAVKILHSGGVVAHPTETCYGLAADIFQRAAYEKVCSLKKMSLSKPISILVRDLKEAQEYGEFSDLALKLAEEHWPGPLTIIVPRGPMLPKWVNPMNEFVGFRVTTNGKAKRLVEAFGAPLTTTSANITTQPQAYSVQEMLDQKLMADYVIDGGRLSETQPSTIVKVVGDEVELIRQGPIELERKT